MKNRMNRIMEFLGYEVRRKRSIEDSAFSIQQELVKESRPMIFDVGADIGKVTKIYRCMFPQASIHCFEPFPQAFEKLNISTASDANIFCHNLALSNKEGTAFLNVNSFSPTNSLLPTSSMGSFYWGEDKLETRSRIEVDVNSIDLFCAKNSINKIDILKIDVQGYEFMVLNGAKEMLASQSISLIYMEIITAPTYEGQHKLHEYLSLLDSFDYELFDFYNPVKKNKQLIQADFLFVSNEYLTLAGNHPNP